MAGIWAGFGGDFYGCFYSLAGSHRSNEKVPAYLPVHDHSADGEE